MNARVPACDVIILDSDDEGLPMRQMASPDGMPVVGEPAHPSKSSTHLMYVVRVTRHFFSPTPCIHICNISHVMKPSYVGFLFIDLALYTDI